VENILKKIAETFANCLQIFLPVYKLRKHMGWWN